MTNVVPIPIAIPWRIGMPPTIDIGRSRTDRFLLKL